MQYIHIDFETYSPVDLLACGVHKYASHPDADVLCVAYTDKDIISDSEDVVTCVSPLDIKSPVRRLMDKDAIFVAHNAQFEMAIWHYIMVPRYGYDPVPPKRWRCTAASAAYRSLPRALGDVCDALRLGQQKDAEGKKLMLRLCRPGPDGKRIKPTSEELKRLVHYCIQDVRAEMALAERIGLLPKEEQKLWELDWTINNRGVLCDLELVEAAVKMREQVKRRIESEVLEKTKTIAPSQTIRLTEWVSHKAKELTGKPVKNLKSETLKKLLAEPPAGLPEGDLRSVVQARKDHATTSLAKFDAIQDYEQEGIARGQFVYHGCATGRWSGKGIQFQNLPRGTFDEHTVERDMRLACRLVKCGNLDTLLEMFPGMRPMEILKNIVRGVVIPREDNLLYVLDFAQIEARVLAWLAGQQEVLDAFIEGKDLYKFTASQIYGKAYADVTKAERFIGKVASLALGYQGGAGAFQSMALNYGKVVDEALATKVKDDWRNRNPRIVKFWWDLEDGMTKAIQFGRPMVVRKRITIRKEEGFMSVELPCGRKLWYFDPKLEEVEKESKDGRTYQKKQVTYMGSDSQRQIKWGRIPIYGGKAAENITQAVSRDILVNAMFETELLGYSIIATIHDEIIAEAPEGRGIEDMQKAMELLPPWADGLPLKAAGFATKRYYKG